MARKQARADAERDSRARKPVHVPRRRAAALIAAGLMLAPQPAHAHTPHTPAPSSQPPVSSTPASSETSGFSALRPDTIHYSEAFRDANFTCETGDGMVHISGNVEGGRIEFAVPLDLGAVRAIYRVGSRLRLLSDNYLIVSRADGSLPVNIALPDEAKGALSAWLSTETAFYILSSDGQMHATKPEEAGCPWYIGGPYIPLVEGVKLVASRGLIFIVQAGNSVAVVRAVPGEDWSSAIFRLQTIPEGKFSVRLTTTGFVAQFSNTSVSADVETEGDIGSARVYSVPAAD